MPIKLISDLTDSEKIKKWHYYLRVSFFCVPLQPQRLRNNNTDEYGSCTKDIVRF